MDTITNFESLSNHKEMQLLTTTNSITEVISKNSLFKTLLIPKYKEKLSIYFSLLPLKILTQVPYLRFP